MQLFAIFDIYICTLVNTACSVMSRKNAELRSGTDADPCLFLGEGTWVERSKPPR